MTHPAEKDARCSRCDEVVGTMVTRRGSVSISLSTSSHGDRLPISCPRVDPPPLPLHRTEAGYPNCSTCDGGGCLDCTDPA